MKQYRCPICGENYAFVDLLAHMRECAQVEAENAYLDELVTLKAKGLERLNASLHEAELCMQRIHEIDEELDAILGEEEDEDEDDWDDDDDDGVSVVFIHH